MVAITVDARWAVHKIATMAQEAAIPHRLICHARSFIRSIKRNSGHADRMIRSWPISTAIQPIVFFYAPLIVATRPRGAIINPTEDSGWRDLAGMRNRVRRMLEFKACFLSSGPIANAQAGEGIR